MDDPRSAAPAEAAADPDKEGLRFFFSGAMIDISSTRGSSAAAASSSAAAAAEEEEPWKLGGGGAGHGDGDGDGDGDAAAICSEGAASLGCDGSILISSTPTNVAERDYVDNDIPQQAFNMVSAIKAALESVCPGVVSCADIVVLAAREAITFLGGPLWEVALGRRDSRTSLAGNGIGNIPQSNLTVDELISLFLSKGLETSDLVALSGAHTIGFAKCRQFTFRMLDEDPFLNSTRLADSIRQNCLQLDSNTFVPLDPASPFGFDNSYYKGLQNNMGLLLTDQALSAHPETKPLVDQFASSSADFFQSFVDSIVKMSSIGVLTGEDGEGEIRSICSQIN